MGNGKEMFWKFSGKIFKGQENVREREKKRLGKGAKKIRKGKGKISERLRKGV